MQSFTLKFQTHLTLQKTNRHIPQPKAALLATESIVRGHDQSLMGVLPFGSRNSVLGQVPTPQIVARHPQRVSRNMDL